MLALRNAGIENEVLKEAVPMKGRFVHEQDGKVSLHPYGEEGKVIYSVSRLNLNKLLISKAEERMVKIFFEMPCRRVLLEKKTIELTKPGSSAPVHFQYDYLFGADGAFSRGELTMTPGILHFPVSCQGLAYGTIRR